MNSQLLPRVEFNSKLLSVIALIILCSHLQTACTQMHSSDPSGKTANTSASDEAELIIPPGFKKTLFDNLNALPDTLSERTYISWLTTVNECLNSSERTTSDKVACLETLSSTKLSPQDTFISFDYLGSRATLTKFLRTAIETPWLITGRTQAALESLLAQKAATLEIAIQNAAIQTVKAQNLAADLKGVAVYDLNLNPHFRAQTLLNSKIKEDLQ